MVLATPASQLHIYQWSSSCFVKLHLRLPLFPCVRFTPEFELPRPAIYHCATCLFLLRDNRQVLELELLVLRQCWCARSSLPWLLQRPWPARRRRPRLRHRRHGSPPYPSTLHCSVGRDHGWFFKPQVGSTVSNKNYTVEKRNSSAFHWTQKILARSVKERQSYRSSKSSGF